MSNLEKTKRKREKSRPSGSLSATTQGKKRSQRKSNIKTERQREKKSLCVQGTERPKQSDKQMRKRG